MPAPNTDFTVHHLRFTVEALTPLLLPAHAGPSIRGALWAALQRHFCPASELETPPAEHKAHCPVCWLMAAEKPDHERGQDIPRPYTVEPPLGEPGTHDEWRGQWFDAGDRFSFGVTLFAEALNLFPYLVVAMPIMGQAGLGVPLEENGTRPGQRRRGRFALRRIDAINPLSGVVLPVMGEGQTTVHMPGAPVTHGDVQAASEAMLARLDGGGRVRIALETPLRVVHEGRLVHRPWLGPLFRRLLERLDALRGEYAGEPPVADRESLVALADAVRLVQDFTRWLEVKSGSRRLQRSTYVSGLVGTATYEAPRATWAALLPYLLWGQEVHVGKNATKGDGMIRVTVTEE